MTADLFRAADHPFQDLAVILATEAEDTGILTGLINLPALGEIARTRTAVRIREGMARSAVSTNPPDPGTRDSFTRKNSGFRGKGEIKNALE